MQNQLVPATMALAMGVASVELFSRAWLGFLGVLAAGVLKARGELGWASMLRRINSHAACGILCGLSLILIFRLYMVDMGLGQSEPDQLVYFVGCMARMVPLVFRLPGKVEALFETEEQIEEETEEQPE